MHKRTFRLPTLLLTLAGFLAGPIGAVRAQPPAVRVQSQPPPAAERAWNEILPHLRHAEQNSAASLAEAIKKVDGFFTQAKEGIKPFTDEVFGFEAKAHMAVGAAGNILSGIGSMLTDAYRQLGGDVAYSPPSTSDHFRDFVEARFRKHVLSPDALKAAVKDAVSSYRRAVATVESGLADDVRDANGGQSLAFGSGLRALALPKVGDGDAGEAIDGVAEVAVTAQKDGFIQLGSFAGSCLLAGFLGGQMGLPTDYSSTSMLASFGLGSVIDSFTNAGFAAGGYSPQKRACASVTEALDRMQNRLINGDADVVNLHKRLCRLSDSHPDASVRMHCATALKAMEGKAQIGLRQSLTRVHELRTREWITLLHKQLFNADLPLEFDDSVAGGESSEALITWADGITKKYRGEK